jgi:hypothetical protein
MHQESGIRRQFIVDGDESVLQQPCPLDDHTTERRRTRRSTGTQRQQERGSADSGSAAQAAPPPVLPPRRRRRSLPLPLPLSLPHARAAVRACFCAGTVTVTDSFHAGHTASSGARDSDGGRRQARAGTQRHSNVGSPSCRPRLFLSCELTL